MGFWAEPSSAGHAANPVFRLPYVDAFTALLSGAGTTPADLFGIAGTLLHQIAGGHGPKSLDANGSAVLHLLSGQAGGRCTSCHCQQGDENCHSHAAYLSWSAANLCCLVV